MLMERRSFLLGLVSTIAAPAIVRASSLMPVKSIIITPQATTNHLWRLASLAYEESKKNPFLRGVAYSLNPLAETPSDISNTMHFAHCIVADDRMSLWGQKTNAALAEKVSEYDRTMLMPNSNGELVNDVGRIVYRNVTVDPMSFSEYVNRLRDFAPNDHVVRAPSEAEQQQFRSVAMRIIEARKAAAAEKEYAAARAHATYVEFDLKAGGGQ